MAGFGVTTEAGSSRPALLPVSALTSIPTLLGPASPALRLAYPHLRMRFGLCRLGHFPLWVPGKICPLRMVELVGFGD